MSAAIEAADLAVVVIGFRAPPELVPAVRSLLAQDMPAEIVVVNSGGGDAARLLREAGLAVPVTEVPERLYAGGARNVGIAATRAPFVAFLAADCLAAPGWVAERLRRHHAGARAVASAVMPDADSKVAWAHHLLLFPRRLPRLAETDALRYGASFDRKLFDEVGLFDGNLRTGEDTEFAARLAEPPAWAPGVVTLHRNARTIGAMLSDQYARGRRYCRAMRQLRGSRARVLAKQVLREPRRVRLLVEAGLAGDDLRRARASLAIMRIGSLAKAAGIVVEAIGLGKGAPSP